MTPSQRIIVNTTAQYTRTLINVCLSLYSTRLILSALGDNDYGIYMVISGVVAMLSFLTNALQTTTQRFLSFQMGRDKKELARSIFGNSLLLHSGLACGIMIICGVLAPLFIQSILVIDVNRISAAYYVYISATLTIGCAILTAPFRALFIAREEIVYMSIVDIMDGLLKVLIAWLLTYFILGDALEVYGWLMFGIALFNLLAFAIYAFIRFEECYCPSIKDWDSELLKQMGPFAGWTIYSTGCVVARAQLLAIIINRFLGTIANTAYGIAQQVSASILFISQSILNAMSPQIVKAEGANNRSHMLALSTQSCKYSLFLQALVTIPLISEMPAILEIWLGHVPTYSIIFCRGIAIAAICDQLSLGLGIANNAIGDIKKYTLVIFTLKVCTIPAVLICLLLGCDSQVVMICYVIFELLSSFVRIPLLHYAAGLDIKLFLRQAIIPNILPISLMIIACVLAHPANGLWHLLFTIGVSMGVGLISGYICILSKQEKTMIHQYVKRRIK